MAALLGHMDYWNAPAQLIIDEFTKQLSAPESRGQAKILGIIYSLLSVITVVGNALVIAAVCKDPLKILKTSPSNFILLSLSIADLIVGLVIDPWVASWFLRVGETVPPSGHILVIFSGSSIIVSVGHVLLLTVDRYYALATPLKYRAKITRRRVTIASCSIWISCICYAVVVSILQNHLLLMWFISVALLYICSECICVLYLATLRHLVKHSRSRIAVDNSQSNAVLVYQREKKVFKVIVSVIFVFFLCFIPWLGTQFVIYFCKACHNYQKTMIACFNATTVFPFINSAFNPFVYSWTFSKFRATFRYFWRKFRPQKGRKKTVRITERRKSFTTSL